MIALSLLLSEKGRFIAPMKKKVNFSISCQDQFARSISNGGTTTSDKPLAFGSHSNPHHELSCHTQLDRGQIPVLISGSIEALCN